MAVKEKNLVAAGLRTFSTKDKAVGWCEENADSITRFGDVSVVRLGRGFYAVLLDQHYMEEVTAVDTASEARSHSGDDIVWDRDD